MVKVRKARLSDVGTLVELWKEFVEEHREFGIGSGEDLIPDIRDDAPEETADYYSKSIRSKNSFLLVIEDEGLIKGFMLSKIIKNIPIFSKEWVGYLASVYIQGSYRGKGLSSEMFRRTIEWFERKEITEISLQVMCCNPQAREVYKTWGFNDIHYGMRLDLDRD